MAFGVLLFMGLFFRDSAGFFGDALRALSGGLFGITGWFLPFLVFGQGAYRLLARSGHPLWNRFFNLMLLMMLVSAMFQVGAHPRSFYTNTPFGQLITSFFKEGANTLDALSGQDFMAGGIFGGILGVPLLLLFQKAGAMVVLATLGLVVALIVTRISLVDAARSVARGTAGRLGGMAEAARMRREARHEMYEAQTRLMPELDEYATPPGTATGEYARRNTKTTGSAGVGAKGFGSNGTGVPGSASTGSGAGPYARLEQAVSTAAGLSKTGPQPLRERGSRFLDVAPEPQFEEEDAGEEKGPSMSYPASFVHPDKDMGDLRIGLEDELPGQFDPFTGEMAHPSSWTSALEGELGMASPDEEQGMASLNEEDDAFLDSVSITNLGLEPTPDPKAEWLKGALAPVPEASPSLQDLPEKDLATQWEETLARQEEQRRTGSQATAAHAAVPQAISPQKMASNESQKSKGTTAADGNAHQRGVADINAASAQDEEAPVRPYTPPPVQLLKQSREDEQNMRRVRATAEENARKLEATLESFGIGAKVVHISVGPAITRYELQPAPGIKVSRIVNLTDDIALNLASSGVRIEAPIPGKAAIGVEVPNKEVAPISLRSVLESKEFDAHPSKLAVALGKDISGENMVVDLAKMPHVLIAGATGSGKSVCINSIVISLLYKAKPEEVKLLMIDPKVVELGVYNGIPHLLIPVVTDPNKAAGALRWAVQEMVMRYKLFADRGVRDLAGYNASVVESGDGMKLPQIVIIIDELADLMMVAPHDVEDSICRLAQMARAAGMHLVIATQRPSVNVITGVIKANVPSRVAFSVSSQVDSRTIIDMAGAEKLLGKGDMLYYPVGLPKPVRVKGCFISDKEVELVVDHVKAQMRVRYDEDIIGSINDNQPSEAAAPEEDEEDGLLEEAVEALIDSGQASVSFIQRRFKVGYARAGRIIDQMAEKGIISGYEGSKPRRVLITREMWNELRMQKDIRAAESARQGKANEQMRLRTPAEPARTVSPSESRFPAGLRDVPGSAINQEPVTTPANSAFLRRAMSDAEERERHGLTHADALPDEEEQLLSEPAGFEDVRRGPGARSDSSGYRSPTSVNWESEDID